MSSARALTGWLLMLAITFILGILWAASVQEPLGIVLTGMLGTVGFIAIALIMLLSGVQNQGAYGIVAVVCSVAFVAIWMTDSVASLVGMQGVVLGVISLFYNAVIVMVIAALLPRQKEEKKQDNKESHDHTAHHHTHHVHPVQPVPHHTTTHHHHHQQQAEYYKQTAEQYAQQLKAYQEHARKMQAQAHMHKKYQEAADSYAKQNSDYQKEVHSLKDKLHAMQSELIITKKNVSKTLRSIEDKCKAINFAIGRVYADKKGGSAELRNKLMIHRDWYNTFSEITAEYGDEDAQHLLSVLEKIHGQLLQMEQPEKEVFTPIKDAKIPAERKKDGSQTILDVMIENDKDPVSDFHGEAKEVCEKLINYLRDKK